MRENLNMEALPEWFAHLAQDAELVPQAQVNDAAEMRRLVNRGLPAVITNLGRNAAHTNWSKETLTTRIKSKQVRVECYEDNNWFAAPAYEVMSFSEFLSRTEHDTKRKYYLADFSLGDYLPELDGDFPFPSLVSNPRIPLRSLYLGCDTVSAAHFHSRTQSLHFPIQGDRYFLLVPPTQTKPLYAESWSSSRYYFSRIRFDNFASSDYPLLTNLRPLFCKLSPGNSLFIPIHWWHLVTCPGFGIAVNCAWRANWTHWGLSYPSLISFARLYLSPRRWIIRR